MSRGDPPAFAAALDCLRRIPHNDGGYRRATCSLRALARLGEGIALLPDFPDVNDPGLVKVLPDVATAATAVFFVYPSQRFVAEAVRRFIDLAVTETR